MAGSTHFQDAFEGKQSFYNELPAPANGGTIDLRATDGGMVKYDTDTAMSAKLPAASNLRPSMWVLVSNAGTGVVTINDPSGVLVDTVTGPNEIKAFMLSAGGAWQAFGGVSAAQLAAVVGISGADRVGIRDIGGFTSQITVEGALAELYLFRLIGHLQLPLNCWRESTNFNVGNIAANGGVLASDTTPILSAINGATDGCQRIQWAASNNDQIVQSIVLPDDLVRTQDITFNARIASGGTTNAVGFTLASYFDEGDTAVADASGTNQTVTYANVIATIAAADIPATARTLTIGLTPVAHTTDTLNLTATWLTYARN